MGYYSCFGVFKPSRKSSEILPYPPYFNVRKMRQKIIRFHNTEIRGESGVFARCIDKLREVRNTMLLQTQPPQFLGKCVRTFPKFVISEREKTSSNFAVPSENFDFFADLLVSRAARVGDPTTSENSLKSLCFHVVF